MLIRNVGIHVVHDMESNEVDIYLYFGVAWFKSRPGYRLTRMRFPPGKCRNRASVQATTASFHILFNSLFTNDPTI
jgi:hypothetical protein